MATASRAALALMVLAPNTACDERAAKEQFFLPAGDLTVFDRSSKAFKTPPSTLSAEALALHLDGDAAFEATFVTAPADVLGGLGPTFNHQSCGGCHLGDGRGLALAGGPPLFSQLLVRVSLDADDAGGATPDVPGGAIGVPGMGTQIQDHAVYGETPEAVVAIVWQDLAGTYGDGTPYVLRRPNLTITTPDGAPLRPEAMTSPRQAPPVFGLGLLEAVPEATIEALGDADDSDGDGISGRPNRVWDPVALAPALGRFGWKANTVSVSVQVAAAYFNDMGVTNPIFDGGAPTPDIEQDTLAATTFYVQTLGAPEPWLGDDAATQAQTSAGEARFRAYGCNGCHVETLTTAADPAQGDVAAIIGVQTIHPYTDLLLHDMGDGLADHRPDFEANGNEWRTTPLWGIGLTQTVLGGAGYLHDGRARTFAEAILWHGGEAEAAREAFRKASQSEREALLAFLASR